MKLVHLFRFLIIFLFPLVANAELQDKAVFKIENKSFFVSDLNLHLATLSKFSCMFGKKSFVLNSIDLKDTSPIDPSIESKLIDKKDKIMKLIFLNKLIKFSNSATQGISSSNKPTKRVITCFKKSFKNWNNLEKTFYNAENYLKDRFGNKDQIDKKKMSDFISTLNKSIKHDYFF